MRCEQCREGDEHPTDVHWVMVGGQVALPLCGHHTHEMQHDFGPVEILTSQQAYLLTRQKRGWL